MSAALHTECYVYKITIKNLLYVDNLPEVVDLMLDMHIGF